MLEMQMSTLQKQEISFLSKSPVLFVRWSWFPKINIIVLPISRHIVIKEAQQSAPPDVTLSVSVILIKFNEMWLIQLPWVFLAPPQYFFMETLLKSDEE